MSPGEMMSGADDAPRDGRRSVRLQRFTRAELAVHHATALLMVVCLATAALLYLPVLSTLVGHREAVKTVHVWCGFALPVPIVLGLFSRAFRADLGRLNRFAPHDWRWLRSGDRRLVLQGRGLFPVGKFNAGQKLNAAFTAGAILVMLGTGAIMTFPDPWGDRWRTGATFVHDWLFLLIVVVTAGHLWEAFRDRGALQGLLTGHVELDWALRHHAGWADAWQRSRTEDGAGPERTEAGTADGHTSAQGKGAGQGRRVRAQGEGASEFAERPPGTS